MPLNAAQREHIRKVMPKFRRYMREKANRESNLASESSLFLPSSTTNEGLPVNEHHSPSASRLVHISHKVEADSHPVPNARCTSTNDFRLVLKSTEVGEDPEEVEAITVIKKYQFLSCAGPCGGTQLAVEIAYKGWTGLHSCWYDGIEVRQHPGDPPKWALSSQREAGLVLLSDSDTFWKESTLLSVLLNIVEDWRKGWDTSTLYERWPDDEVASYRKRLNRLILRSQASSQMEASSEEDLYLDIIILLDLLLSEEKRKFLGCPQGAIGR